MQATINSETKTKKIMMILLSSMAFLYYIIAGSIFLAWLVNVSEIQRAYCDGDANHFACTIDAAVYDVKFIGGPWKDYAIAEQMISERQNDCDQTCMHGCRWSVIYQCSGVALLLLAFVSLG